MKISIRKAKTPRIKTVRRARKAKSAFKMPKIKMPKIKMPKIKMPNLRMPRLKKMEEAHYAVMILAVVAVISVVGLFMYMPMTATNSTGAVAYTPMCESICAADEVPVGFTAIGSGQVECLCKKVG